MEYRLLNIDWLTATETSDISKQRQRELMFLYDEWIKAVNFKFIRFNWNTQKMLNCFSFDYIFLKPFIFTFVSNVWLTWLFVLHCLVLSTYYTGVYILMIMYSQGASSLYNANVRVHNRIFRCDSISRLGV